ncbi:nucleotidyltransferase family protein [Sphingomonas baiyangensis]|uniref:Nucleotidyltransferase family protein n=1 Tax=Sphingomonas baiyangensis TaxID=2572576 RepID=A0A4U1LA46_9SPHN|nr:nucleotidyltransferase family protein [Sphingomonas baiyangensis]TKD53226.1 nucleotidyltransferase family protein [Sphingomonas baiyangensis]
MIAPEATALVLLAAGRSQRFGDLDKLDQPYLAEPLAFHVVTALEAVPFARRIAVVSGTRLDFGARGYEVVRNERADDGQGHSLALCVAAARAAEASAVLVALADMPRVTATHIYRLLDAAEGDDAVVASSDGVRPMPPALFGAGWFDRLEALEGDAGARRIIAGGRHIVTSPAELVDIDTPADLEALRAKYAPRG